MMVKFSSILMLVLFFGAVGGSQPAWAGEAYHGKVVDAETGEPLEGAAVVVYWIKKPLITMDGPQYFHNSKEVLTNAAGKFSVNASPGKNWNPFRIMEEKPTITIFKPGYGPYPLGMGSPKQVEQIEEAFFKNKEDVTVSLPKLNNKEELLRVTAPENVITFSTCHPSVPKGQCIPLEQIPNLARLVNIQRKNLGLNSLPETSNLESRP